MKKLTTKQNEAIELLLIDLDELENKPRRLYYALEQLALAFDKKDVVPSLREAQENYYTIADKGDVYRDLFYALKKYKIETWDWQIKNDYKISEAESRIRGAEDFAKVFIKILND